MLPKAQVTINPQQWNSDIANFPGAHILQTWEWSKVKSQFGWQPSYLYWISEPDGYKEIHNQHLTQKQQGNLAAAALALRRNITIGGFSHRMGIVYVPKGPLLDWSNTRLRRQVLQDLNHFAVNHNAIFIKIDPDFVLGTGVPGSAEAAEAPLGVGIIADLQQNGWTYSDEQVQFRNTVLINLSPSEAELLASMKQKTRYNVNLAARKGVTIRIGKPDDIHTLFRMYAETSLRDGFTIRNEAYYREVWNTFIFSQKPALFDQPSAEALIAEVDGETIAAAIIFYFANKAWYLYGMSFDIHRDKMPNYLLQWEAMKRARAAGCQVYDLWGAPDEFIESDPLWGVYRFKEGLGGTVSRTLGAWDLPINRMLYRLYSKTLPGLLDIMRMHGRTSTRQAIG